MEVRTRFAVSPTGYMHVGGVRTALFAWLFARKHGGQFILRIEDTDKKREMEGAIGHIMQSLTWLGIDWDEGPNVGGPYEPYVQSSRLELYQTYACKLVASGFAYPDPYTVEEVEAFRVKAEEEKRPFLFRDHRPETTIEWDGTMPLRFRTPTIKRFEWHDLVRGDLSAGEEALDDFILIKGDGYPTYNFCHVVDDIEMKITHVMRGEEFISSTPKFLSLYEALELPPPFFATLPSILGPDGKKKLSKRDGAKDILDYKTEGYMHEALVNFLALLGWNPGTEQEIFSAEELIAAFNIEQIQRSGAHFNDTKLLSVNQHWIRSLSDEEFILRGQLEAPDQERLLKAVSLLKERAQTFSEAQMMLTGELLCLFLRPTLDPEKLLEKEPSATPGATKTYLEQCIPLIEALPEDADIETIKTEIMELADSITKENGGRGAVLWPLRYTLSGLERSPDPFSLIYVIGKEEAMLRIEEAIGILD
jgi:glutamyl-tRNA synthetase